MSSLFSEFRAAISLGMLTYGNPLSVSRELTADEVEKYVLDLTLPSGEDVKRIACKASYWWAVPILQQYLDADWRNMGGLGSKAVYIDLIDTAPDPVRIRFSLGYPDTPCTVIVLPPSAGGGV